MTYLVVKKDKILKGSITLEGSKSISNRALIIRFLCEKKIKINNLSASDDTQTLQHLLNNIQTRSHKWRTVHAGDGGTTFRFLAALLAIKEGNWILTGSERMKQRPIGILAEALKSMGADIEYLQKKNFPPLKIRGKELTGGKIAVPSHVSSQFVSALLMIAPQIKGGLSIRLEGKKVSLPYIKMTLAIMRHFGIRYSLQGDTIVIGQQPYKPRNFTVEADWSAASYFYEMAAFSEKADFYLKGLKKNSLQGDSVTAEIMKKFAIKTFFRKDGIRLIKNSTSHISHFTFDFTSCPDLAQTMLVTCAGLRIPATATGITNLRIKETDRISALKKELKKINTTMKLVNKNKVVVKPNQNRKPETGNRKLETYNDHRMAMALAPLAILKRKIRIEHPEVVSKSYPAFWKDLKKAGFEIKKLP